MESMDYHNFVDRELSKKSFRIIQVTEKLINKRLDEIAGFVNSIRKEYSLLYEWTEETIDYFLNPMDRKFEFSFLVEEKNNHEIAFVSFASVYSNSIHIHFYYAGKNYRNLGLAKLHIIKLCQASLDYNFKKLEGYAPKKNSNSIRLLLSLGYEIESIRNLNEVFFIADLKKVRDSAYNLYLKSYLK
jgi:RimJ/RimL family protein N-acetyltransferase